MNELLAKLRPERPELVDAGWALGLTAVALWAFEGSFGGIEFFVVGVIAAAIGVVTAHVCMRFKLPFLLSVGVWFVVYVLVGGVLAARSQAILGIFPSPDTVAAATRTMVRGWKELLTTVPPVGRTGDLLLLPVFCGLVAGASGYTLARTREWPAAPAVPIALVLALGILCGVRQPVSVLLHGGVFGVGVIIWAAIRDARRRPPIDTGVMRARRTALAGALLAVAAIGGLVIGDSLPMVEAQDRTVWRDTFEPPFDPSVFPSPLGYYRQYVKEFEEQPLFEVTGLPEGVPIRLATLDDYDGIVWKASGGTTARRNSAGYFQRVGTDVDPDYSGTQASVQIRLPVNSTFDEVWLPTVGEVESVSFDGSGGRARELADNYRYNSTTDTGAMLGNLRAGDSYTLEVTAQVSWDDLPADAVVAESNFEAIEGIPPEVSGLASALVEDIAGPERITVLRDFLRGDGDDSRSFYSSGGEDESPVPPGHGAGRLVRFAGSDELIGNAEQYAATMALILRNDGIPARVVMGFEPKDWDPDGTAVIFGGDAEAWVEVLVEDIGWVQVSPTPDRSKTTVVRDNSPKPIPDRETQVPPPPPILEPDADTDPASESEQSERERDEEEDEEEEPVEGDGISLLLVASLVAISLPFVVFVIVLLAILLAKRLRRSRRATRGRSDQRVANGWCELVDYAVDAGTPIPSTVTRREAAERVAGERGGALARRADAVVFGPYDTTEERVVEFWGEVDETRREMRSRLGLVERTQAALSLESFRRAKQQRQAEARRERRRQRERDAKKVLIDS